MEYQRFGDGWVRRRHDGEAWKEVALDDVPAEVIADVQALEERKDRVARYGYDPEDPPQPFAVVKRVE